MKRKFGSFFPPQLLQLSLALDIPVFPCALAQLHGPVAAILTCDCGRGWGSIGMVAHIS